MRWVQRSRAGRPHRRLCCRAGRDATAPDPCGPRRRSRGTTSTPRPGVVSDAESPYSRSAAAHWRCIAEAGNLEFGLSTACRSIAGARQTTSASRPRRPGKLRMSISSGVAIVASRMGVPAWGNLACPVKRVARPVNPEASHPPDTAGTPFNVSEGVQTVSQVHGVLAPGRNQQWPLRIRGPSGRRLQGQNCPERPLPPRCQGAQPRLALSAIGLRRSWPPRFPAGAGTPRGRSRVGSPQRRQQPMATEWSIAP